MPEKRMLGPQWLLRGRKLTAHCFELCRVEEDARPEAALKDVVVLAADPRRSRFDVESALDRVLLFRLILVLQAAGAGSESAADVCTTLLAVNVVVDIENLPCLLRVLGLLRSTVVVASTD